MYLIVDCCPDIKPRIRLRWPDPNAGCYSIGTMRSCVSVSVMSDAARCCFAHPPMSCCLLAVLSVVVAAVCAVLLSVAYHMFVRHCGGDLGHHALVRPGGVRATPRICLWCAGSPAHRPGTSRVCCLCVLLLLCCLFLRCLKLLLCCLLLLLCCLLLLSRCAVCCCAVCAVCCCCCDV